MSVSKLMCIVFVLCAVMIFLKTTPMLFMKGKVKNKFLKSFLAYIPCAVLTSMTFPEVFYSTNTPWSASIAVIVAVLLSYFGQSLISVIVSSTITVFVVEQIIKFI